jgi:hypothetical protein
METKGYAVVRQSVERQWIDMSPFSCDAGEAKTQADNEDRTMGSWAKANRQVRTCRVVVAEVMWGGIS